MNESRVSGRAGLAGQKGHVTPLISLECVVVIWKMIKRSSVVDTIATSVCGPLGMPPEHEYTSLRYLTLNIVNSKPWAIILNEFRVVLYYLWLDI